MSFQHEVRYVFRQFGGARTFTATAILTLALGIAGSTMFFVAVNAMVFRPLRATRTDGLYVLNYTYTGWRSGPPTAAQFRRLQAHPPTGIARLGAVAAMYVPVLVAVPDRAERVDAEVVTAGYPLALDLVPQAGRMFVDDDELPGTRVAIIGDRLWREWFRGDPGTIGRTISVNAEPFTIVGVAPRGFRGAAGASSGTADVWLTPSGSLGLDKGGTRPGLAREWWLTFVRLRPETRKVDAESAIHALLTQNPEDPARDRVVIRLHPAASFAGTDALSRVGMAIVALSGLLVVAACANLANMLFARGTERAGELAVRRSLGAGRRHIVRLLLIESSAISLMAALVGLVLALAASAGLAACFPSYRYRRFGMFVDLSPDYRVLLYAVAAGGFAALTVGLLTAWRASTVPPLPALAASGTMTGTSKRRGALRDGLVTVQVMAAVVLLMGAGLFIRASGQAIDRALLFDPAPLTTARVDLRVHAHHPAAGRVFFERVLQAVRALPGVERAALADGFPVGDYLKPVTVDLRSVREVKGQDGTFRRVEGASRTVRGGSVVVSPDFLATMGLPLRRGRDIAQTDQETAPLVVVINETAAGLLWPGQDPIGKPLMFGHDGKWRTVVGVCGDPIAVANASPLNSPANLALIPAAQEYRPEMLIVVRSRYPAGQLEPLRGAIRATDDQVVPFDVAPAEVSIMAWAAPFRAVAVLSACLGLLALTIATLGVYGVVAYAVGLRRREFGIRMALGARANQIVRMVVDDAIHVLLVGLLAGVFVTAILERYLQSQRVGFLPNEILTWCVVLALIAIVGLAAALFPARRASRIDPNVALRHL